MLILCFRAIINHFNPKIESYAAVNHISQLSEEQVLEVVRANYDTLTLKLQDGLDQYERYSEQHKEAAFFKELQSRKDQVVRDEDTHQGTGARLGRVRSLRQQCPPLLCSHGDSPVQLQLGLKFDVHSQWQLWLITP
uniref:Armadillo like helical domain containing 3 n=1 Tax=Ovis aries TaxID=9940 RepID=A0AC11CYM3_SHEEP